jgi:hypothetical protein
MHENRAQMGGESSTTPVLYHQKLLAAKVATMNTIERGKATSRIVYLAIGVFRIKMLHQLRVAGGASETSH